VIHIIRLPLEERNLGRWNEFEQKNENWKFTCSHKTENVDFCPRHMLSMQPDFQEQKSSIEEIILATERGHMYSLHPKFNCETNWIERYWSYGRYVA
jgi:hypothetical protein